MLSFKIPIWFDLSNRQHPDIELNIASDIRISLFWNSWRESTEAGIFTAIQVILSSYEIKTISASVGIGLAFAALVALVCTCGTRCIARRSFGISCSILMHLLAVGLFTGFIAAFVEVSEIKSGDEPYWIIYEEGNSGKILDVFGFMGLSHEMSLASFSGMCLCHVFLIFLQYYRNYKGYDFKCREAKTLRYPEKDEVAL
jgi:hypothetical protein